MDLNRLFVVVFEWGVGKGGELKPFRGLGACSTEIQTSEIAKLCASCYVLVTLISHLYSIIFVIFLCGCAYHT